MATKCSERTEGLTAHLHPDGRVLYALPSCRSITVYEPRSLLGELVGNYVHPDDSDTFIRELHESSASGNALRFFYRFMKEDGTYVVFKCNGHPHINFTADADTRAYAAL
jgi:PAS domain-containing protein